MKCDTVKSNYYLQFGDSVEALNNDLELLYELRDYLVYGIILEHDWIDYQTIQNYFRSHITDDFSLLKLQVINFENKDLTSHEVIKNSLKTADELILFGNNLLDSLNEFEDRDNADNIKRFRNQLSTELWPEVQTRLRELDTCIDKKQKDLYQLSDLKENEIEYFRFREILHYVNKVNSFRQILFYEKLFNIKKRGKKEILAITNQFQKESKLLTDEIINQENAFIKQLLDRVRSNSKIQTDFFYDLQSKYQKDSGYDDPFVYLSSHEEFLSQVNPFFLDNRINIYDLITNLKSPISLDFMLIKAMEQKVNFLEKWKKVFQDNPEMRKDFDLMFDDNIKTIITESYQNFNFH